MFTTTPFCHTFCAEMEKHTRECELRQTNDPLLHPFDRAGETSGYGDHEPYDSCYRCGGTEAAHHKPTTSTWVQRAQENNLPVFTTHQGTFAAIARAITDEQAQPTTWD